MKMLQSFLLELRNGFAFAGQLGIYVKEMDDGKFVVN